MKKRTLGRTGLECSVIGLGTMAFGNSVYGGVERNVAVKTIRAALDGGINVIDTAPLYGVSNRDGVAEEVLGEALLGHRDKALILTKFGRGPSIGNMVTDFTARQAQLSVEASLRRLKTDHIDVLFFHSPFSESQIHDDVWTGLDRLRAEGKVRFLGHSISMFEDTSAMSLRWVRERRIEVVQAVLSLMNREASAFIAQVARDGVGVVARECLANGFLSGTITPETVFPPGSLNARYDRTEIARRAAYAGALGWMVRKDIRNLPQAALRWVLDQPGVSLALAGASNLAELTDALAAARANSYSAAELAHASQIHTVDFVAA